MKTAQYYTDTFFPDNSPTYTRECICMIQEDALRWAASQITPDGNPELAQARILAKVKELGGAVARSMSIFSLQTGEKRAG